MTNKKLIYKWLFAVTCLFYAANGNAQNVDINLLKSINPQNPNSVVMRGISSSVYPLSVASPVAMLAVGYIKKDKRLEHFGWEAVGSLAINTIVTQGLKYTVNRNRPYVTYPGEVYPYTIETDPSFPSGHTSTAFATATTLSLEYKKWYVVVPAYLWAAGVGYSRLYLGEHYPTDVLAGAVVGAGSAWLSHWLTKKVFRTGSHVN
jgi:undecaprenyl-diphosphatase